MGSLFSRDPFLGLHLKPSRRMQVVNSLTGEREPFRPLNAARHRTADALSRQELSAVVGSDYRMAV